MKYKRFENNDNRILVKSFDVSIINEKDLNTIREKNVKSPLLRTDLYKSNHLEDLEGQGFLAGHMSFFDNEDLAGDIIRRGSFTKTLNERTPKVLFNHDQGIPIGKIIEAFEDKQGLFAIIQLNLEVQAARDVFSHFKFGSLDGFSIGFQVVRFEFIEDEEDEFTFFPGIDITEVKLFEVSAVAIPANEKALVQEVKKIAEDQLKEEQKETKELETSENEDDLLNTLKALVKENNEEVANLFIDELNDTPAPEEEDHLSKTQAASGQETKSAANTPSDSGHLLDEIEKILKGT